jgi:hypothetical protein
MYLVFLPILVPGMHVSSLLYYSCSRDVCISSSYLFLFQECMYLVFFTNFVPGMHLFGLLYNSCSRDAYIWSSLLFLFQGCIYLIFFTILVPGMHVSRRKNSYKRARRLEGWPWSVSSPAKLEEEGGGSWWKHERPILISCFSRGCAAVSHSQLFFQ